MISNNDKTKETLSDFEFDNDIDFFGTKSSKEDNPTSAVIKEVKSEVIGKKSVDSSKLPTKTDAEIKEDGTEEEDDNKVTFFGEELNEDIDEVLEEEEDKESAKDKTKKKTKEEEVVTDEDDTNKEVVEEEEESDEDFYTTLTQELIDKKVFQTIKLEEGKKIKEEDFFELVDADIENRVEETVEALLEKFDDDAKEFFRFKQNGGRTADFFAAFANPLNLEEEFDESNKAQVDRVVRNYLAVIEKLSAEDIEDRVKWLEDSSRKTAYAKKYFESAKKTEDERKAAVIQLQKDKAIKAKEDIKDFNTGINKLVSSTEPILGVTLSKEDRKELEAYIIRPIVKSGKDRYVPQFSSSLSKILKAATPEDQQKLVLLAKIIKDDFKFPDIETAKETEVTRKTKSKLAEAKKHPKLRGSGSNGSVGKKELTDFF